MEPATASQGFVHQACVYRSDGEFLSMAVPFIEAGLDAGEPVLAATTSANLELLRAALADRGGSVDYADSVYFGRRPAQRVAAFDRYWKKHAASPGYVRVIAEPIWTGRSEQEIRAWKQMEAGLNLIFVASSIWMICPYDGRILRPDIVADAHRTHPTCIEGRDTSPSGGYADPERTVRFFDTGPLPPPPGDAASMTFTGDLARLRAFVGSVGALHGLARDDAALFVTAAAEAASYAVGDGGHAVVAVWERPGAIVCDLHKPGGNLADPLLGLRPPDVDQPRAGDGLWFTRQLCESVQTWSGDAGCTIRLHVPTSRVLV